MIYDLLDRYTSKLPVPFFPNGGKQNPLELMLTQTTIDKTYIVLDGQHNGNGTHPKNEFMTRGGTNLYIGGVRGTQPIYTHHKSAKRKSSKPPRFVLIGHFEREGGRMVCTRTQKLEHIRYRQQ